MSALHLVFDSPANDSDAGPSRPCTDHIPFRVGSADSALRIRPPGALSLSPASVSALSDLDEVQSSAPSDLISSFASLPDSSISGSVTSFDYERTSDDAANSEFSSLSPAPSLYSLTESLREQAIRQEHGRGVNTHSEVYRLAADEEEAERLDRQHQIYKKLMGDYVPPMREILANDNDPLISIACLDAGCGSGAWVLDVALEFPHVSCTAVDLVPLPAMTQIPPNLRFEIDDVSLGLEHFAGDFDVFHARFISTGVKDYYRLIDDAALALRPRGLADFTECDFRAYNIDKRPIVPTTREIWGEFEPPEGWTGTGMARCGENPSRRTPKPYSTSTASTPSPFLARFAALAGQAARKRGGHVDAAALLHRWISEHRAYEDVVYRDFYMPCAPWMRDKNFQKHSDFVGLSGEELEKLCSIGQELRDDIIEFMASCRPLLLSTGIPEALIDFLQENSAREVTEARIPLYFRVQNVYARKKGRQPQA